MSAAVNDPGRLAAKKLWLEVGPGQTFSLPTTHAGVTGCDPLLDRLDDLREPQVRGDTTYLHLLQSHGFVISRLSEDRKHLTYHLVKMEPPVDSRTWAERDQAVIDRQVAWEQERMNKEYETSRRNAEFHDAPEQAHFVQRLFKAGLDPQALETRLAAIEATLERVEAALAAAA